jgi:hypothetical protein
MLYSFTIESGDTAMHNPPGLAPTSAKMRRMTLGMQKAIAQAAEESTTLGTNVPYIGRFCPILSSI